MRRNIVLAIATVLLAATAANAAPNKQVRTDANSYQIADHQNRFKVGYGYSDENGRAREHQLPGAWGQSGFRLWGPTNCRHRRY